MVIESLGRCYMQNINDVLEMIELNDYEEPYIKIMKPLKYVEIKKVEGDKEINKDKKSEEQPNSSMVPKSSS